MKSKTKERNKVNEPKSLSEIKQLARNENKGNLYIAIEQLCDYVQKMELRLSNKPNGEPSKEDIKKKGSK